MLKVFTFFLIGILSLTFHLTAAEASPEAPGDEKAKLTEAEPEKKADTNLTDNRLTGNQAALIAYTMGGNLVRQGRPRDALRYYLTALANDPKFVEAMNDAALIYKVNREYEAGRKLLERAIEVEPKMSDLYHSLGEIYQAEGLEQLSANQLDFGTGSIQKAVTAYGQAIEIAEKQGILATRAASYFRLGEICYFANRDLAGARQYWTHVMSLHSATPELSEVDENYYRLTRTRVTLVTWQKWAKQYLDQIAAAERSVMPTPTGEGMNSQPFIETTQEPRTENHAEAPKPQKKPGSFLTWRRFTR